MKQLMENLEEMAEQRPEEDEVSDDASSLEDMLQGVFDTVEDDDDDAAPKVWICARPGCGSQTPLDDLVCGGCNERPLSQSIGWGGTMALVAQENKPRCSNCREFKSSPTAACRFSCAGDLRTTILAHADPQAPPGATTSRGLVFSTEAATAPATSRDDEEHQGPSKKKRHREPATGETTTFHGELAQASHGAITSLGFTFLLAPKLRLSLRLVALKNMLGP
jgi:hypothetical protein